MIMSYNDSIAMLCETPINIKIYWFELSFPAINYSKSTTETVEKVMKYVQS